MISSVGFTNWVVSVVGGATTDTRSPGAKPVPMTVTIVVGLPAATGLTKLILGQAPSGAIPMKNASDRRRPLIVFPPNCKGPWRPGFPVCASIHQDASGAAAFFDTAVLALFDSIA